jgi:hypothetical protein
MDRTACRPDPPTLSTTPTSGAEVQSQQLQHELHLDPPSPHQRNSVAEVPSQARQQQQQQQQHEMQASSRSALCEGSRRGSIRFHVG